MPPALLGARRPLDEGVRSHTEDLQRLEEGHVWTSEGISEDAPY